MENDKQYLDMFLETEVINTGIGISKDKQKYLFVPFKELRS
jgi:signal transduction histidine kinase